MKRFAVSAIIAVATVCLIAYVAYWQLTRNVAASQALLFKQSYTVGEVIDRLPYLTPMICDRNESDFTDGFHGRIYVGRGWMRTVGYLNSKPNVIYYSVLDANGDVYWEEGDETSQLLSRDIILNMAGTAALPSVMCRPWLWVDTSLHSYPPIRGDN